MKKTDLRRGLTRREPKRRSADDQVEDLLKPPNLGADAPAGELPAGKPPDGESEEGSGPA